MKLKRLEIELQKISGFENPKADLEQYLTPPDLAARFLFDAFMHGDIEDLKILDLGCGTGMLSVGSALLGAEQVTGIDIDRKVLQTATENAEKFGLNTIEFREEKISPGQISDAFDTAVMNPPFGAQQEHADRPFIEYALNAAPVVWGIFNKGTIPFLKAYTKDIAEITDMVSAKLTIPKQFFFHTKDQVDIPVECVRLEKY